MKDYDETEAIEAMMQALAPDRRNEEATFEVLDLIYEYYEQNGDLDVNIDDDDIEEEVDVDAIVAAVCKQLRRRRAAVDFTPEEVALMVEAELDYQDSLL